MVRAWYIEGEALENPKDEHHQLPPRFITLEELYEISGVEYHSLNVDTYEADGSLAKIKEEKGYEYEDILETPGEGDLQDFYKEHLHENDEIRFVLDGCGYYDIRDKNDEWIRVEVVGGDLLVVPGGCYHRFMLDHSNSFKAKRLFMKSPMYTSHKRPADNVDSRRDYLKKLQSGGFKIEAETKQD